MMMRAILIVLMLACMAPPVLAQNDLQAEEDELKATELRLKIARGLRDLDYFLEVARDNVRITDLTEKYVIQEENTGYFLRRAHDIAVELARSATYIDQNPHWLQRYEKRLKRVSFVRKIAAALHGMKTITEAMLDADSSSGAEKIEALADVIQDMGIALDFINPLVSLYIGKMAKVVRNMAESARVIEARHDKTIKAIEEDYDKIVYGTDYTDPEGRSHPLDDAIEQDEERLQELQRSLQRAANEKAFQDVVDAEEHCYKEHDTDRQKISQTRQQLSRDMDVMRTLRDARKMMVERIKAVQLSISGAKKAIYMYTGQARVSGEKGLKARADLRRAQSELTTLNNILKKLKEAASRQAKPLFDRFYEIRDRYKKNNRFVKRFNKCVAEQLESAEDVDRDYVDWNFPDYKRRPNGTLAVKNPKSIRADADPRPKVDNLSPLGRIQIVATDALGKEIEMATAVSRNGEELLSNWWKQFDLPPGEYTIRFYHRYRIAQDHTVTVSPGRISTVHSDPLGRVQLSTNPLGKEIGVYTIHTEVYLDRDGDPLFGTWHTRFDLPPGNYFLKCRLESDRNGPRREISVEVEAGIVRRFNLR